MHLFSRIAPAAAALLLACAMPAHTQTFPTQAVRILSPFSAGSGPDVAMRIVAEQMSAQWKQPVLIENRTGASGFIALSAARSAAPGGHELVMADVGHLAINPSMFRSLPYHPREDFLPVGTLFRTSFFVTVAASSKIRSMKELVEAAARQPGVVTYGSFAVGSIGHLGGVQLEAASGTRMTHVPFKEAGALYSTIAGGDVTWGLGAPAGPAGALMKAEKLRFLAVADEARSPLMPDVPTIQESGGPGGVSGRTWVALLATRGTPQPVVQVISRTLAGILAQPEVAEKFRAAGLLPWPGTPADLAQLIEADTVRFGALVKRTGLTPE